MLQNEHKNTGLSLSSYPINEIQEMDNSVNIYLVWNGRCRALAYNGGMNRKYPDSLRPKARYQQLFGGLPENKSKK